MRRKFFIFLFLMMIYSLIFSNDGIVMNNIRITSAFCDYRFDHFHTGIDISGNAENIYSLSEGELIFYNKNRPGGIKYGNGNFVIIEDTKNKKRYNYSHLSEDSINTEKIEYKKGDIIGLTGSSGYSTGPHLHLEIEDLAENKLINPVSILKNVNDTRKPRILDIFFVTEDNEEISLVKKYNYKIKRGGKLFVKCIDYVNNSNINLVPYKIRILLDGKETVNLSFAYLKKQDHEFILPNQNKFDELYLAKENFTYYIMDYKGLPGLVGFKVEVEDFFGNKTVFRRSLRILMPD